MDAEGEEKTLRRRGVKPYTLARTVIRLVIR
jgi:hypothetical protein